MGEELRHNPNAIFITLTIEDKWYENIEKKYNIKGDNYRDWETDRKSTRLNSSHITRSRMPSSA